MATLITRRGFLLLEVMVSIVVITGGLLFVFIIAIYLVVQFIIDHLKRKSTDYLCLIGVIFFLIAGVMFFQVSPAPFYLASLVIALFITLVLSGISWPMARKKIKPVFYPLALVGLGLAGLAIFYAVQPSLLKQMQTE